MGERVTNNFYTNIEANKLNSWTALISEMADSFKNTSYAL